MNSVRRLSVLVVALGACAVIVACSQDAASAITAPMDGGAAQRLTVLADLDQRVARVAQNLSEANVSLCSVVRQSAG